jgi:hypothetical protein
MSNALILELYRFSFDSVPFACADCLAMPCPFKADKTHGPPDILRLDKMYDNSAASVINGKTNMNKYKPREIPSFALISVCPFISSETSRSPAWDYLRKYLVSDCPKDVTMISSCSVEPCHSGPCFEINSAFWTGDPLQHLTTSYRVVRHCF